MRICRVATVPFFLRVHLYEQIRATVRGGHDVTLVCSSGPEVDDLRRMEGVRLIIIEIPRKISPLKDCAAVCRLVWLFLREDFDIIHSTTPKAGLLCSVAGWIAGCDVRLHTFTGQVWAAKRGWVRVLARLGDWITAHFATLCFADSQSQRDYIVEQGVASGRSIKVIGPGSLAGVNLDRFSSGYRLSTRHETMTELGIPLSGKVVGFMGRMTVDKGVSELVRAFLDLRARGRECRLLMVGPLEPDLDPLPLATLDALRNTAEVYCVGYTAKPEKYLAAMDVLCLPSYREGFPNVVMEAAAMGLPTVGTDIVGMRDAVVNGVTGLLVAPGGESAALANALDALLMDDEARSKMGEAAKLRATLEFDRRAIDEALLQEYRKLVRA